MIGGSCHNKIFVAIKILIVASPAKDVRRIGKNTDPVFLCSNPECMAAFDLD